jgi:hypothetical protein
MNKKLIFSVLLICLLAIVAVLAFGQNSSSVRWEYTSISYSDFNSRANQLGSTGWELVAATNNLYFKRRLP